MSVIAKTAVAAALTIAGFTAPAHALSGNAPVPFFLAPFFQQAPQARAYAPPTAYAPQYEEQFAPRRAGPTRETIAYNGRYAPGTIIINTTERRLYYVLGGGRAIRYAVGVGRDGFRWAGTQRISNKQEWPEWRPPADMIRRRPDLPRYMAGGPANPLGARALYLGSTLYRIHGSNEPETIGQAVSSGCIRMLNEDVVDLYDRVRIGTQVVVLR